MTTLHKNRPYRQSECNVVKKTNTTRNVSLLVSWKRISFHLFRPNHICPCCFCIRRTFQPAVCADEQVVSGDVIIIVIRRSVRRNIRSIDIPLALLFRRNGSPCCKCPPVNIKLLQLSRCAMSGLSVKIGWGGRNSCQYCSHIACRLDYVQYWQANQLKTANCLPIMQINAVLRLPDALLASTRTYPYLQIVCWTWPYPSEIGFGYEWRTNWPQSNLSPILKRPRVPDPEKAGLVCAVCWRNRYTSSCSPSTGKTR